MNVMWSENCTQNIFDPYLEHSSLRINLFGDELMHHGVKGMKWGVRRYQNTDGTLTSAGRKHYGKGEKMDANNKSDSSVTRKVKADYNNLTEAQFRAKYQTTKNVYRKRVNKWGDPYRDGKSFLNTLGKNYAAKQKAEKEKRIASLYKKVSPEVQKKRESDLKTAITAYNKSKYKIDPKVREPGVIFNELHKWGFSGGMLQDRKEMKERFVESSNHETGEDIRIDLNTGEIKITKRYKG